MNPTLSAHAYQRFQERFWPCSYGTARAYILAGVVGEWVSQGATRVLRGDIEVRAQAGTITTVIRRDNPAKGFSPADHEQHRSAA